MSASTKRELELELAMWRARSESAQNAAMALQAQAQLLQINSKDVQANIERVETELKAFAPALEAVKAG